MIRERSAVSVRGALWFTLVFLVCLAMDRLAYVGLYAPGVVHEPWHEFLRAMGTVWPWFAISALIAVTGWRRGDAPSGWLALRQGALVSLSACLGGAAAEILKLALRRERPILHDGFYVHRSFAERAFSTSNLDLPSSHAGVAFGGACMVALLFPRAAGVALALAAGCALTRVLAGGHFLSAAVMGAGLAYLVARWLWSLDPPNGGLWTERHEDRDR